MIHKPSLVIQLCFGLALTVSTVNGQCDRAFTATSVQKYQEAIVESSGTCTWVITADTATSIVKVSFTGVTLPVNGSCDDTNSIIVHDGDTSQPILGLVCMDYCPAFTSSGSTFTLRYPASIVNSTSAFRIKYDKRDADDCGISRTYAVSTTEYSLQSPGYPAGIQNDLMYCVWNMRSTPYQRILLTIETTSTSCSEVNATIVNGDGRNATWCPGMPNIFMSWSHIYVDLEIATGQSVKVKYRTPEVSPCRQFLNATTQEQFLSTPNWPSAYPSFTECRWHIQNFVKANSSMNAIKLEVVESDMEETEGCKTDILQVIHNWAGSNDVLATTCDATPKVFYAYGKTVLVVFRSVRPSNTRKGIRLKYMVTAAEPCGGNLTANSSVQSITSPGFPVYFPELVTCVWTISAANPVNYIKLEFVEMRLGNFGFCENRIEIFDGSRQSGTRLERLCDGNNHVIKSLEPAVVIVFRTGRYPGSKGFKMYYMEIEDSGPVARTIVPRLEMFEFMPPRYPQEQVRNLNMTWTIKPVIAGAAVMLNFTEVNIGHPANCSNNYVKVFKGNTSSPLSSTLCGTEKGVYMGIRDDVLTVVMKTGSNPATRGFKALSNTMYNTVSGGCDGTTKNVSAFVSDKFTDMQTINYPNNYPNLADCSYLLESLFENYFMRVKIADAGFADSGNCTKDFIELFDGSTSEGKKLGKICGNTTQVFESTGRTMLIRMITDANLADRGAKISYQPVNKDSVGSSSFTWLYIFLGVLGAVILVVFIGCVVCAYRKNTRKHDLHVAYKT